MQNWDLDNAIKWFHEHKNDDEYKVGAETEFDSNEKEQGNILALPFFKSRNCWIARFQLTCYPS